MLQRSIKITHLEYLFTSSLHPWFHVCSVNSPRLAPTSTYASKDLNQDFIALIILVTWRHFYDHWQLTDSCPIQFKKHYLSPSVLILMSVLVFYYVEKKLTAQNEQVGIGCFKLNIGLVSTKLKQSIIITSIRLELRIRHGNIFH